jgi:hypothetical protein
MQQLQQMQYLVTPHMVQERVVTVKHIIQITSPVAVNSVHRHFSIWHAAENFGLPA